MTQDLIRGGYILLSRKLLESEIMQKPHLYLKLWLWMLMQARFKDRGNLKRGQFFTSLKHMQEAMNYKIGYRVARPTLKEIRSAYDFLAKGNMIVITKVTHGMIITVLNYEHYQHSKNYEGHSEGHDEGNDRGTRLRKKERKKDNIADSRISTLVSFFSEECFSYKGWKPQIDGGDAKTVQRALKGMTENEVREAITFYLKSQKAKDFGVTLKAALSTHSLNHWKAQKEKANWQTI